MTFEEWYDSDNFQMDKQCKNFSFKEMESAFTAGRRATAEEWCKETGHSVFDGSVASAWEAGRAEAFEECLHEVSLRTDCNLKCTDDLISCSECIAAAIREKYTERNSDAT